MRRIYLFVLMFFFSLTTQAQIPKTISYQGVLTNDSGEPLTGDQTLTFKLYDAASGGSELWQEAQTIPVTDGIFSVIFGSVTPLDLPFDRPYWLGVSVGSGTELEPRIELTGSAYSMNALSVADSSITSAKLANGATVKSIRIGSTTLQDEVTIEAGDNVTLALDGNRLTISADAGVTADTDWNVSGDDMYSAVSGRVGIGTDDPTEKLDVEGDVRVRGDIMARTLDLDGSGINRISAQDTFEVHIGGERVLRIEPVASQVFVGSMNIIAGAAGNTVAPDVHGATIAGGGYESRFNRIDGEFGTISGGFNNTISGPNSTVSGGTSNSADANNTTVGGGANNKADEDYATVGGGLQNNASGRGATVPGGANNSANGSYSFAAGIAAKANHDGAFVWQGGAQLGNFSSTGANQFIIRAAGGVGIGTNAPGAQLDVNGDVKITNKGDGATLLILSSERSWVFRQLGSGASTALELISGGGGPNNNKNFIINTTGNVGIGTTSPDFNLEVNGSVGKPGGGSWSNASDKRLKDVKGHFTRGLEAVSGLNPIVYKYKKDNPLQLPSEREYVGLIAQEVQKVIPEAVETDKGEYLHLNNDPIIWTMLNAIKQLNHTTQQLHRENVALKTEMREMRAMKAKMAHIETTLHKLERLTAIQEQQTAHRMVASAH